jgi:D-alanine-D-alanine ligase
VPNILEVNPLPGILPNPEDNSCFPKAAHAAGLTYNQMINEVLNSALKRYGMI